MVIQGYFFVGIYKYAMPGSLSDWIFVFKVARSASYDAQSFIGTISADSKQAQIFLSSQENSDNVASI